MAKQRQGDSGDGSADNHDAADLDTVDQPGDADAGDAAGEEVEADGHRDIGNGERAVRGQRIQIDGVVVEAEA